MYSLFKDFYLSIGKRAIYWGPLLLFSLLGYSFSIFNRTIHWDDLLKDYYNEIMLSNRWGMVFWGIITGTSDLVPFTDRFLTLLFMVIASVLMSVLFFLLKNRSGDVLSYTVLSSMVLTFPLINEIYEYTGADLQYTGNLALMVLAFIYLTLKRGESIWKVFFVATSLMILPASSYEVAIFSYITLLCAFILYKYCIIEQKHISLKQWIYENSYYLLPVIAAVIIRFVIAFLFRNIYDIPFNYGGSTSINHEETTFVYLIGSNMYRYFIAGLVYFPITVFVFSVVAFIFYVLFTLRRTLNFQITILGFILIASVFSLTIIQGVCMQYRTAQAVTIFVSFVAFLFCEIRVRYQLVINVSLLFLCCHQAAYINNVLSLNNMRSNNEAACIRYIGFKLVSEFDIRKPVVLITKDDSYDGYLGPWIDKRVHADNNSWNGRLFNMLTTRSLPERYHNYKYINSNINNAIDFGGTQQQYQFFQYYGFDLNVQEISTVLSSIKDSNRKKAIEMIYRNLGHEIPPLGVLDVGECIFVNMVQ